MKEICPICDCELQPSTNTLFPGIMCFSGIKSPGHQPHFICCSGGLTNSIYEMYYYDKYVIQYIYSNDMLKRIYLYRGNEQLPYYPDLQTFSFDPKNPSNTLSKIKTFITFS